MIYDKERQTIVNNESSEIIRMFNSAFNHLLPKDKADLDLYPEPLRPAIDGINSWVYDTVNSTQQLVQSPLLVLTGMTDGVYKAGFATTQNAYDAAVVPIFDSLDRLEKILTGKDYLVGEQLTEADIRLFVTIVSGDEIPDWSSQANTSPDRFASTPSITFTLNVTCAQSETGILP